MKKTTLMATLTSICLMSSGSIFAQDDETRQSTGLPMKIGENVANTGKAALSGKVTIRGLDANAVKPFVFVLINYSGIVIERKQTTESGNFFFPSIPRENVTIVIEVNGNEVGRQQMLPSMLGNIRQDFDIIMPPTPQSNDKTGVISAKASYERNPENEKLFGKAIASIKDKKTKDAEKLLKQIVEKDPKDFIAWSELGTLYFNDNNLSDAEASYLKAHELKSDFIPVMLNLGRLFISAKQTTKAIEILSKAVASNPESADAHHLLGEAYLSDKKGSKAVVELNEALRIAPLEKAEIHLRLATLYNAAGIKQKAAEEYKKFIEKQPNHPDKMKFEKYVEENSIKQ